MMKNLWWKFSSARADKTNLFDELFLMLFKKGKLTPLKCDDEKRSEKKFNGK